MLLLWCICKSVISATVDPINRRRAFWESEAANFLPSIWHGQASAANFQDVFLLGELRIDLSLPISAYARQSYRGRGEVLLLRGHTLLCLRYTDEYNWAIWPRLHVNIWRRRDMFVCTQRSSDARKYYAQETQGGTSRSLRT